MTPNDICKELHLCLGQPELEDFDVAVTVADPPSPCVLCTHATTAIEAALQKQDPNATIEHVRQGIEMMCHVLSDDTKCRDFLKHFDQVATWLKEGKDPREICQLLQLCPKQQEVVEVTCDPCALCMHATGIMEQAVQNNQTVEMIRMGIDTLCHYLADDSQCEDFMTQFDEIVETLQQGEDPHQICKDMQFCSSRPEQTWTTLTSTTQVTKDFCAQLTYGLQFQMVSLTSETQGTMAQAWEQDVGTICDVIGILPQCHVVAENFNQLIESLADGQTPVSTCNRLFATTALPTTASDPITCMACEQVAKVIESVAPYGNETLPLVKQGLQALCQYLPVENCDELVDKFDKLAALVLKGESESQACTDVGLCDAMVHLEADVIEIIPVELAVENPDLPCVLCASTGAAIQAVAQYDKSTVPVLKQGLGALCAFLPADAKCEDVLTKFDDLAQLVLSGTSPQDACVKVGMCSSSTDSDSSMNPINDIIPEEGEGCDLCLSMATTIQLANRFDASKIAVLKSGLSKMCGYLPKETQCDRLDDQFDQLVHRMDKNQSPREACAAEGFCPVAQLRGSGSQLMATE